MGRSRTITDEQILEAARAVFLEDGFGASTQEIARQAGISEASIFKRFSTKENLFFAALGISITPDWINDLKTLSGQGDLKENLIVLSQRILDFFRDTMPRMMMIAAKGKLPQMKMPILESPETIRKLASSGLKQPAMPSPPPMQSLHVLVLKALTQFFEQELQLGRIRPCAPDILAHMLLGSLTHYTLTYYIFLEQTGGADLLAISAPVYVQRMIDIFWYGIAPELDQQDSGDQ
ncbi:MAG: TetR/AcrR family transcriptional regulator [Iphinoe sp. HA4291-MV1]|jgi:AcrR family transcriptional regulator|nr:TetR/AcrR family transcriptional regulator [Iphinoe sp. HA4291-MV1]